jgi:hypothetical protein
VQFRVSNREGEVGIVRACELKRVSWDFDLLVNAEGSELEK